MCTTFSHYIKKGLLEGRDGVREGVVQTEYAVRDVEVRNHGNDRERLH
jgi:hypothetical protein